MSLPTLLRAINHGALLPGSQTKEGEQKQSTDQTGEESDVIGSKESTPATTQMISSIEPLLQIDDLVGGITIEKMTSAFADILDAEWSAPMSNWVAHAQFQKIMQKYAGNFKLLPLTALAKAENR